ncbi:MAG: response regulator [Flavobacteriaceae bacterium]|nr:response regulator [Flavobacteriaceae bacterium]
MFKLKGKTIWLFTIIAIGLASVGVYFYTSLTSLNKKVEESIYPQKRSNYLKDITLNINKLNNLYLVDSIKFSSRKVDTIIHDIERNLDSIKIEFRKSNAFDEQKIDTIPKLLRKIQEEYLALEKVKQKSQSRFINDLESLLKEELAQLNLNKKDSVTIVKQITSEIYDRSIDNERYFKEVNVDEEKEKSRGFFQRLFGSSEADDSGDEEAKKSENDSLERIMNRVEKDTIISTQVDTLLTQSAQMSEPPAEMKIISIFERIQRRRIDILENLKERENRIFQKNYEVNNYIENILNEILFEEVNSFNESIYEFTKKSKAYLWRSGILILIFLILALISTYIVIKDINKSIYYQKKLEESEKRALLEAEEKQKFLSTMSHELRTPLTSIIGYTDMLNQDEEYVKAIKTASNYLYQMTNEILDMAKIKAGIIEIKNEAFNLNEVFEMIESNFKPLIINQGLEPIFEHPKTPVYVLADQYRIQQIVYNLVHNALKYTETGFIKAGYTHQLKNEEKEVSIQIVVEDSGVGMSEEEQKSIFKDYHQAGTHKNKMKGTGLGMGIVKNLVNKIGGNLKLESHENKGTKFTIDFVFQIASEADAIKQNNPSLKLGANSLDGYKIFVVDDDLLITKLYQGIFRQFGARIESSNHPKEALQHLIKNSDYDMVIFDMKMPGMTGSELLEELEKQNARPKNTVICSANVLLSEKDKEDFNKFDYQLFKPLKKKDIVDLVAQVFNLNSSASSTPTNPSKEETHALDFSYSLEDLKAYTGDDEEALIEMLKFLLDENEIELNLLEEALQDEDLEEIANRIHKLSSRFAQLQIEAPHDPKEIELNLRDSKVETLKQATKIYEFWRYCNSNLISKYC